MDKEEEKEDTLATHQYRRDYYLKDFSYLSPEVLAAKEAQLFNYGRADDEPLTISNLARKWLLEVMLGLKQFLYGGSLHGVKYIFEPTFSRKERAVWIIIVVISVAICAAYIIQLFSKWTSSPFVNVIDSIPTPIWAVPFPTVVLCPHLHVKLSYADVSEMDKLNKFFASMVCPNMNEENQSLSHKMTPRENMKFQEFILKGSPKCSDIVKSCYWRPMKDAEWMTDECCKELFSPIFTNYGLCYAFNSLPLNGMKNLTIPWHQSFDRNTNPANLQWGLDNSYPKVFPPDLLMKPFRVMASGEANGLGVELYLNASERQFGCEGNSVGFNLLISSPTDHVYTSTVLRLPLDRMTTVEVSPITYKTDWSLECLKPDRRKCFFQHERALEYYDFYTDSNCKHELLIREAKRLCDCVPYNWPRSYVWEPVCSTKDDFLCISDVKAKVEEQLIYAYYADSEEQNPSKSQFPSCHPSCNDIIYWSQVFYSDLIREPGLNAPEWGHPNHGETTRINVHFYNDLFLGQHRHAQYDEYYFVGAAGGLLSLFLGFSIISVAELVYFVLLRPAHAVLCNIYFSRLNTKNKPPMNK